MADRAQGRNEREGDVRVRRPDLVRDRLSEGLSPAEELQFHRHDPGVRDGHEVRAPTVDRHFRDCPEPKRLEVVEDRGEEIGLEHWDEIARGDKGVTVGDAKVCAE